MKSETKPHEHTKSSSSDNKCGAKTRAGGMCQQLGMKNGRCRYHGGKSTGPRTPEGLARSRRANWKHGMYSKEEKELRRQMREIMKQTKELIESI